MTSHRDELPTGFTHCSSSRRSLWATVILNSCYDHWYQLVSNYLYTTR